MSTFRQDVVSGRWVIIAPERARRPDEFLPTAQQREDRIDPFLEGNEHATPGEVYAIRSPGTRSDQPGWSVRVVPNMYPALSRVDGFTCDLMSETPSLREWERIAEQVDDGSTVRSPADSTAAILYPEFLGRGAHEVVIECPYGEASLAHLPHEQIVDVLRAYRERLSRHSSDRSLAWAVIFKNHGATGGASLRHVHSQVIAAPIVPPDVQQMIDRAEAHFASCGRCLVCDLLRTERTSTSRVVAETDCFLAFCPFASRFPYETWLVPAVHGSRYETLGEADLDEFGMALKTVLGKLHKSLDDPPYNFVLHTAPFRLGESPWLHWRLEVLPRLTRVAGFEWGSGCFINPVSPETAAARLRDTEIEPHHFSA